MPGSTFSRTGSGRLASGERPGAPVSFAMLALGVAGAGVLCLALTAVVVAVVPVGPVGRAILALAGLALTIAAMGVTSSRITDRAIRAEYGDDPTGDVSDVGDDERPGKDGLG